MISSLATARFTRVAILAAAASALQAATAAAITISVPLTLAPATAGVNQLELTADATIVSDSDTSLLSGNVASQLELALSPLGAEVTGIRFDGGQVNATDVSFNLVLVQASATGLGGVLETSTAGFSPVTGGMFTTGDHLLTINQGTLTAGGEVRDLSADPFEFSSDSGTATITLQELSASGLDRTYEVTLSLPIDETEQVDDTTSLTAVGNVVGSGQFTATLPGAGDFNEDGVVDSVDYAIWREDFEAGQAPASDFDEWLDNFGAGATGAAAGGQSSANSAPEPHSTLLAALSLGPFFVASGRLTARRKRTAATLVWS